MTIVNAIIVLEEANGVRHYVELDDLGPVKLEHHLLDLPHGAAQLRSLLVSSGQHSITLRGRVRAVKTT